MKCTKCNFTSASEFHLSLHMEHHKGSSNLTQQSFQCNQCGVMFSFENDLKNHLDRSHTPKQTIHEQHFNTSTLKLILEEQIDFTLQFKQFQDSMLSQLVNRRLYMVRSNNSLTSTYKWVLLALISKQSNLKCSTILINSRQK